MAFVLLVNADRYVSIDHGEEYDQMVHLLDEMCSELQVDAHLFVTITPELLYQRECEWIKTHTASYAMLTKIVSL